MVINKEIPLDKVLNGNEVDMVADAIAEYITEQTGYRVESFAVSFNVIANLDREENES